MWITVIIYFLKPFLIKSSTFSSSKKSIPVFVRCAIINTHICNFILLSSRTEHYVSPSLAITVVILLRLALLEYFTVTHSHDIYILLMLLLLKNVTILINRCWLVFFIFLILEGREERITIDCECLYIYI